MKDNKFDRAPAIFINGKNGKVRVYLTVTHADGKPVDSAEPGLYAETLGTVQSNKWTFVAVTVSKTTVRIHLNGILDGIQNLEKYKIKQNSSPVYIGGFPPVSGGAKAQAQEVADQTSALGNCQIEYNLDLLKIFDTAVPLYMIQGFVKGSLGMIEPSFIHLGCESCTFPESNAKCINGFHLCTSLEFYSGVYQAIRVMGWVTFLTS